MKENDKTKSRRRIAVILTCIGLIIAVLLLLRSCGQSGPPSGSGIAFDNAAVSGGWEEPDHEKIIESLNRKVREGMMNISMNTTPVFEDGRSEGNLIIVNETCNNYPQVVEITRNDTGELIYKSGAIPVGMKIEKAKLLSDLPKGRYECTAMFNSVDPETGKYLGRAGAIIEITVKS